MGGVTNLGLFPKRKIFLFWSLLYGELSKSDQLGSKPAQRSKEKTAREEVIKNREAITSWDLSISNDHQLGPEQQHVWEIFEWKLFNLEHLSHVGDL